MVTLGFDLRALQEGYKAHKRRGIGVYTQALFSRRRLAPASLALRPLYDPRYEHAAAKEHGAAPYQAGARGALRPFLREYLWQHALFPGAVEATARAGKLDAMFFPSHLDASHRLRLPYAVMAHDMIQAVVDTQGFSLKRRIHLNAQTAALRRAELVMVNSRATMNDIIRLAGVDERRIRIAYLGVDKAFHPGAEADLARLRLPERFILNVGGVDWRKNTRLLLEAFDALAQQRRDYYLVMAGEMQNDPRFPDLVRGIAARGLQDRVITTGFVNREELAALYARATALLYPSLYEGFGLPPLEAMASGCPVISTTRASIPEVCGDAAILLDPDQTESFGHALVLLAEDEGERRKWSRAGVERAKQFSWDNCASETWRALAECFGAMD
ncbi:MAG: glycosyltransferase family 4 protein [Nitrospinae bacterium]|nr:glycosyltransferase family 4 protein [Nitrospinota bacterium]